MSRWFVLPNPMSIRRFESRIRTLALVMALPGMIAGGAWALDPSHPSIQRWVAALAGLALPLGLLLVLGRWLRHPLRTLSNQVASMREGDYSIRVRGGLRQDVLGELASELNALSDYLREHRLEEVETAALLRRVMEEIGVAVFAFDQEQRLQLVNRAGEQLLGRPTAQITGRPANELGLGECLQGVPTRVLDTTFAGRMGRWALRRSSFREQGHPHQLLVITDLSRTLRDEERQAWKRLIRVMGHELNNSLAPIRSISSSLERLLTRQPRPEDWEDDVQSGLGTIQSRAEALSRFMEAYSRLARLPAPSKRSMNVREWVGRAIRLEQRVQVTLLDSPDATLRADADQLDQLLINLIRNATDAALADSVANEPEIEVQWHLRVDQFLLAVRDNGPGLAETGNLFVPFFTTKPGGSGIGLALCRQIAEAHDGLLLLRNRQQGRGAEALVQLPLG
jgi:PAS domain S-box-containing protein